MKPRPAILLASILLGAPMPPAYAQQDAIDIAVAPVTDPEVVDDWVEQLGVDDWLMRDLATLELGELDPGITLETLEGYLRHEDLSDEQRARLRLACLRRYALRPKGALGVAFGTIRVGAIEVEPIPPDERFPASTILMGGDQIAMVDDRVIDGSFALRVEILSRDPGQTLPVTIIRDGVVMHLKLPLGSYDDLNSAVRMDSNLLSSSLHRRWERLGISTQSQDSIGSAITQADWEAAAFPSGSKPDPREPDLSAPRGYTRGPGTPVHPDGIAWDRSMIDVWSDPGVLRSSAEQRAALLMGERIQPMVALRLIIERERASMLQKFETAEGDERETIRAVVESLTEQLDTISQQLERARLIEPQTDNP